MNSKPKPSTCATPWTLLRSNVIGRSRPRDRKPCAMICAPFGPSARVSVDEMSNLTKIREACDYDQWVQCSSLDNQPHDAYHQQRSDGSSTVQAEMIVRQIHTVMHSEATMGKSFTLKASYTKRCIYREKQNLYHLSFAHQALGWVMRG